MSKAPRQRRRSAKDNLAEKQDQGTRVRELAKQYNLTTKELIAFLEDLGVDVKDDKSALDSGHRRVNRI